MASTERVKYEECVGGTVCASYHLRIHLGYGQSWSGSLMAIVCDASEMDHALGLFVLMQNRTREQMLHVSFCDAREGRPLQLTGLSGHYGRLSAALLILKLPQIITSPPLVPANFPKEESWSQVFVITSTLVYLRLLVW